MTQPDDNGLPADEDIAAIMAALAAYMDTEPHAVRVAAVRPLDVPVRSLWGLSGRQQQHASRHTYQGRSRQ